MNRSAPITTMLERPSAGLDELIAAMVPSEPAAAGRSVMRSVARR
jgi:hypothetical protein